MRSFLTGLATDIVISFLTAPRSGKRTRQQLVDLASQQTKQWQDRWDRTVSKTREIVEDVKVNAEGSESEPIWFANLEAVRLDEYVG